MRALALVSGGLVLRRGECVAAERRAGRREIEECQCPLPQALSCPAGRSLPP